MNAKNILPLKIKLKNASLNQIVEVASRALNENGIDHSSISAVNVSGNSGSKTYLCSDNEIPKCIVKISSGDSIMNSHKFTLERVEAATNALRAGKVAPPVLMKGSDFQIELSAGISVKKDFFNFQPELAPLEKLAQLLALIHSTSIDWYQPLKQKYLERDAIINDIFSDLPDYAPAWCLPWSGLDTGMPVLGVGNPAPKTAKKILALQIETGVFKKIMQCTAFYPTTEAARRQVVVHNDFKPDNVLCDRKTGRLTAIDYDLTQVGPAIMDFGLPYMMWLGPRFTTFKCRKEFVGQYLKACDFSFDDNSIKEFMLDCEVNTIVAFPGLLSNIYDAEIPLLRGRTHPTAKAGFQASGPSASPTGLQLVDLLSEAVVKIRSDKKLADKCIKEGLVNTIFKKAGLGSEGLFRFLKEMQKNQMLRLFGIPETDDGNIFVSEHAKN